MIVYSLFLLLVLNFIKTSYCSTLSQNQRLGSRVFSVPFHEHNGTINDPEIITDENIYFMIKKEVKERPWLQHHQRLKIFLTTFSSACIIFELLETFVERIPLLHKRLKFFMKLRVGVLFLCLSHLLHLLHEFLEKLEDREEYIHYLTKKEKIHHLLSVSYDNEMDAAKAYDRAAIELYSTDAILNFHYPACEKDEDGNYPLKMSRFRGVKYCNKLQAWQVDGNYLGI